MAAPAGPTRCLAFDFGAGSGRAILAELAGGRLEMTEIYRCPSLEVQRPDGPHWDMAAMFGHVEAALAEAARLGPVDAIGVDAWGLDYGLVDAGGALLAEPCHYRHPRARRGHDAAGLPAGWLAEMTGAQVLEVNTLFQLIDEMGHHPDRVARAGTLLMIADLVNFHLTGVRRSEVTLARTTGLHDGRSGGWSAPILRRAGLPARLFAPLIAPGQVLGRLRPDLARQAGLPGVPVIAVAGHDTASAVAGLPLRAGEAFVIAGSWMLVGHEAAGFVDDGALLAAGFGQEGGIEGRANVVRSLEGMHLVRRLRGALGARGGVAPDFAGLSAAASAVLASGVPVPAVDPTDPALRADAGYLAGVAAQFSARGLPVPQDAGVLALSLYLGLADQAAAVLRQIAQLRGVPLAAVRIGGGGAQDALFCRLLAAASGLPVLAGPVEASATGNALMQLVGLGRMPSLTAARALIANPGGSREYRPDPGLLRGGMGGDAGDRAQAAYP